MKPWTTQFVTCLWASGGFDGIAELHNRELGKQLNGQMNNNSEECRARPYKLRSNSANCLKQVIFCPNSPEHKR